MRKIFPVFLILLLTLGILIFLKTKRSQNYLKINSQVFLVEVAKTQEERNQGLSGREPLGENQGMLFIFERQGFYLFWMKGMKFDLDFIFIKGDLVVDLAENIIHPKENQVPQGVNAEQSFDKVLEVNAGLIKKYNLAIGDKVVYNFK